MLAAAVDSVIRFLMQQRCESVPFSDLSDHLHHELVLIYRHVYLGIYACKLMLGRRYLIVFRLGKHTELPQLFIQLFHELRYLRLDGPEIMIVEFLPLRRHHSEQSPSCESKVRPFLIEVDRNKEIFLFCSGYRMYSLYCCIAQQFQHSQCLIVQRIHGPQQRCLLIHCFAAVGTERGRYAQCLVSYKCKRRRIPCRISSGFKGRP